MWEKWSFFPIFLRDYSHQHFLIRESTTCDFAHWNAFECLSAQFHLHSFTGRNACCVQAGASPLPDPGEWNLSRPWQLYRQRFLLPQAPEVCAQRGAAWNPALPAGHPQHPCESWGASAVLTPAWSSQLGLPSWAHSQRGFLLQRDLSHKHKRAEAKICLTRGRRVGKWVLLGWAKIPFSSKLWSPHQPGSSHRGCSHSMQRLFFPSLVTSLSGHGIESFPGW